MSFFSVSIPPSVRLYFVSQALTWAGRRTVALHPRSGVLVWGRGVSPASSEGQEEIDNELRRSHDTSKNSELQHIDCIEGVGGCQG